MSEINMTSQNAMHDAARRYQAVGLSIIPVGKNKKPLLDWKKYQTERASAEEINTWFTQWPDMQIGIVTGAISEIVVIDVEAGGDMERFPSSVTVKTGGGGFHRYYKHPGHDVSNSVRVADLTDIRGDGGYVVAPPSISEKGGYEWILPPWNCEMAEYPTEIIKGLQKPSDKTHIGPTATIEHVPEGQRNDMATRYIGSILATLPPEHWDLAGWGALREWNATRTEKPLDERELRSVFESIRSRETQTRMDGFNASDSAAFKPITLTELYSEPMPEVPWLVKDLIPLGAITAITGDSNTFKTFLTCALSASVASGQPYLGQFPTTQGKALIVDEENHRLFLLRKRFTEMGTLDTKDILILSQKGVKLDIEQHYKDLKALIDKEHPTLVVLDSLVRFHSREENSSTEMARVMSAIRSLTADDRAIVVIHHHKKEQGFKRKNSSQSVRGSSDIFASLDCHLAIDRKYGENKITISQTKLRVQEQMKSFNVSLEKIDGGTLSFVYKGEDTDHDERVREVADDIKAVLAESAENLTFKMLQEEVGVAKGLLGQALKVLQETREVTHRTGAHNARYYRLASEDPEAPENDTENGGVSDEALESSENEDNEPNISSIPF